MKRNVAWVWLIAALLFGGLVVPRAGGAAGRRVGSVVTVTGRATAGGGPGGRPLLPWAEVGAGDLLRLEEGARVVVVLDSGGRYVLEGPVGAKVEARTITRQDGAGRVQAERALPAGIQAGGSRGQTGRVLGTVLRSDPEGVRFSAPTPAFGAVEVPVVVAWIQGTTVPQRLRLQVRRAGGGAVLFERSVPGQAGHGEYALPVNLPRATWLRLTLSAFGDGGALGDSETWVRIAAPREAAGLKLLAERALAAPNDPVLALLLVERYLSLGILAEAEVGLNRLQDMHDPGVAASARELRRRLEALRAGPQRAR